MYFCVVLCIVCFVSFSVLFVCICVLHYCHRVATELQLNILHQTVKCKLIYLNSQSSVSRKTHHQKSVYYLCLFMSVMRADKVGNPS